MRQSCRLATIGARSRVGITKKSRAGSTGYGVENFSSQNKLDIITWGTCSNANFKKFADACSAMQIFQHCFDRSNLRQTKKVQSRALGGLALIGSPTSSSSAKASKNAALIPWNYFESFPKWYMIVAGLAHITDLIGMVQALNNQFLIPNWFLYSVDDHRGCKRWVLNGCRREGFNLVPV